MSERDPCCPFPGHKHDGCITCDLIASVRADERAKIAQAIEEQREQFIRVTRAERDGIIVKVYDDAARVARSGGRDAEAPSVVS